MGVWKLLFWMTDEIAALLNAGEKLAFRIGKREPMRSFPSLPWLTRRVACSSVFTLLSFNDSWALAVPRLSPLSVRPPPKVASGWLKIELCCPCSWARSAERAVELDWLMPPPADQLVYQVLNILTAERRQRTHGNIE